MTHSFRELQKKGMHATKQSVASLVDPQTEKGVQKAKALTCALQRDVHRSSQYDAKLISENNCLRRPLERGYIGKVTTEKSNSEDVAGLMLDRSRKGNLNA